LYLLISSEILVVVAARTKASSIQPSFREAGCSGGKDKGLRNH
jgi:hypothetical protein